VTTAIEVLEPEVVGAEIAKVEQQAGLAEDSALALRSEYMSYWNDIT
jgi:predicted Ser/Thr protein kinase